MDLDFAVCAHAEWKQVFRTAILRQEPVDVAAIRSHHGCAFGLWLFQEGQQRFARLTSFDTLIQAHGQFHTEAGNIAELINARDYQTAEARLAYGSPYHAASQEIALTIMALKREAGL